MPSPPERPEDSFAPIHELLEKQRLVERMVHSQATPRRELVESLVHRQHAAELRNRLARLHSADVAHLLEALPREDREIVWREVRGERGGEVLVEVSDEVRPSLLEGLDRESLLALLAPLDADDLSYLAEDIPPDVLRERFDALPAADRDWLRASMSYPEDTVGALMGPEMVVVRQFDTLPAVLESVRARGTLPAQTDKLFVVNARRVLTGVLSLEALLMAAPEAKVSEVMARDVVTFSPMDDAHDAALAFERYDLVSAPVVDGRGKLVGRLTVDAVMDYVREDHEDDTLVRAGLQGGEDLYAPVWASARNRWVWLSLNLLTAFVASRVIGLFEATIEQLVALAALMPIVASIGGNTGNQTTALVIRGLALDQIGPGQVWRLLRKECAVSLLNGAVWGTVVAVFALALYHDPALAVVIAAAMLLNLLIAATVGVVVPLALEHLGHDPAMGASVLLTATTDAMGFFIFLGLAALFLV